MSLRNLFIPRKRTGRCLGIYALSAVSGLLAALAFPPFSWTWTIWVAYVPLLIVVLSAPSARSAALRAALGGFVFYLAASWPLMSAAGWTGWEVMTNSESADALKRTSWFMTGLWLLFAGLWCGALFWGLTGALLRWFQPRVTSLHFLWLVPTIWVVLAEWARTKMAWGFHWLLAGNVLADNDMLRQLASIGGVWMLSALVLAINAALANAWFSRGTRDVWKGPAIGLTVLIVATATGLARIDALGDPDRTLMSATIQYSEKTLKLEEDFTRIGLSKNYLGLTEQAVDNLGDELDLLVLPESVAVGALSLDGTELPDSEKPHFSVEQWNARLGRLLDDTGVQLVLGADTVASGRQHNSLLAWTVDGHGNTYHKRELVPFGEYQPFASKLLLQGKTLYSPGREPNLIQGDGYSIGGFICQEVAHPHIIRSAVRAGADLLVSGGNDGVFLNPSVALSHHRMARLRAVESGRYMVRAMRTGVSSIITPTGEVLASAMPYQQSLLRSEVGLVNGMTPYMRFGNWLVWLFVGLIALLAARMMPSSRTRDKE